MLPTILAGIDVVRAVAELAFWSAVARARLRARGAAVGRRLRVRGRLRLHCHRTGLIRIGDDCRIQSGFAGNPVGGSERMAIWVGPGGRLTLGDRVALSSSTIVCMDAVSIGDGSYVGGGSRIYDTDFHSLDPAERGRPGNPGARTARVTLGQRVFVGGHATVLKGVRVGDAAVLGAGSVVSREIPAREVWAGNPAVRVRATPAGRAGGPDRHGALGLIEGGRS